MLCRILRLVFPVAFITVGACTRQDEPPPPFNEVMKDPSGGAVLPPVTLHRPQVEGLPPVGPTRFLKKIEGPAGGSAEAETASASGAPAEGGAPAIVLNDSDPNALMEQFAQLAAAGNIEAIAMMLVPEQQPIMKDLAAATKAIEAGVNRMQAVLKDKDAALADELRPGADGRLKLAAPDGNQTIEVSSASGPFQKIELVNVNPVDDNSAEATVRQAGSQEEKKWPLVRVEGKWRVKLPDVPPAELVAGITTLMKSTGEAFSEVAAKVESGQIQPANVVQEIFAAQKRLMEASEGAQPTAAEPTTPSPSPAPRPQKRGLTRSGRDPNQEQPTADELLGRQ